MSQSVHQETYKNGSSAPIALLSSPLSDMMVVTILLVVLAWVESLGMSLGLQNAVSVFCSN